MIPEKPTITDDEKRVWNTALGSYYEVAKYPHHYGLTSEERVYNVLSYLLKLDPVIRDRLMHLRAELTFVLQLVSSQIYYLQYVELKAHRAKMAGVAEGRLPVRTEYEDLRGQVAQLMKLLGPSRENIMSEVPLILQQCLRMTAEREAGQATSLKVQLPGHANHGRTLKLETRPFLEPSEEARVLKIVNFDIRSKADEEKLDRHMEALLTEIGVSLLMRTGYRGVNSQIFSYDIDGELKNLALKCLLENPHARTIAHLLIFRRKLEYHLSVPTHKIDPTTEFPNVNSFLSIPGAAALYDRLRELAKTKVA